MFNIVFVMIIYHKCIIKKQFRMPNLSTPIFLHLVILIMNREKNYVTIRIDLKWPMKKLITVKVRAKFAFKHHVSLSKNFECESSLNKMNKNCRHRNEAKRYQLSPISISIWNLFRTSIEIPLFFFRFFSYYLFNARSLAKLVT